MKRFEFTLKPLIAALAVLLMLGLGACTTKKKEYVEQPVETLYNAAMDALLSQRYGEATKKFDEVERQHPYSQWATKAQLMSAYTYYLNNLYGDAIVGLNRFIQLHPTNKDVAYAYYLKGLSYYEQISDIARDQKMTELALTTLNELIKRFPNSKYARDAKIKIDLTHDHLAGKEMEIGRYYQNQGNHLAAINRFRTVVDNYQTTTHVPEALHRLTESYLALGVPEEARKTAAVLGHNFPGSEWYLDSYKMMGNKVDEPEAGKSWYKLW
ncbi:MAG: outer membrane protein assembly factor BamD [Rhodospirillaceae bacterium]|jgi:outer membrane protein assembly factor BamD|nr:outer membrane protein assembly factor BamD [Rhodospirillaceae bacterium]|tara:strand:+ start:1727 stop:2533 length:807 start_codon:yes stop_codon:yes gene_type:complete